MLFVSSFRLLSARRIVAWVFVLVLHVLASIALTYPWQHKPVVPAVAAAPTGGVIHLSLTRHERGPPDPALPADAPNAPKAVPPATVATPRARPVTPPRRPLRLAANPRDLVKAPLQRPDVAPREIASYRVTDVPEYPLDAYEDGAEGWVVLIVLVGRDGVPEGVSVARSVSPQIDAAAIAAIARWRFEPGLIRGRPVQSWISVPIGFFHGHLSEGRTATRRTT